MTEEEKEEAKARKMEARRRAAEEATLMVRERSKRESTVKKSQVSCRGHEIYGDSQLRCGACVVAELLSVLLMANVAGRRRSTLSHFANVLIGIWVASALTGDPEGAEEATRTAS